MENDNSSRENIISAIHHLIENIQTQLADLTRLVNEIAPDNNETRIKIQAQEIASEGESQEGKIIEGVFDGQNMIGPEGKVYTVPANYASKSKLVSGDILKLTVRSDGTFIYKQIGPMKRRREVATLVRDASGNFRALTKDGQSFRLLLASVTYYKGEEGDQVIILLPNEMESRWAAVENILKKGEEDNSTANQPMLLAEGDDAELPSAQNELPLGDGAELP